MRRALITGILGQDGYYLAHLLAEKGYKVFGMFRQCANLRVMHEYPNCMTFICGDMLDQGSLSLVLEESQPDEIYNLAALSFVGASWKQPILTNEVNGQGTVRLLEAARQICPKARFYQASSSEMFGNEPAPQSEMTSFRPRSPYGASKIFAHNMAMNYRESYGMFVACGILFNHESPRRGHQFVTRKITSTVARIKMGADEKLQLGNLSSWRDWGFAGDYVQAMWLMLGQERPADYVIGTGVCHQVGDFAQTALELAGLDPERHFGLDQSMFRPAEVNKLQANARKARLLLGWEPAIDFHGLVKMMVGHDLELLRKAA